MATRPLSRREPPMTVTASPSSGRFSVIATAALTSAGVSLLMMWLWGQMTAPNPPSLIDAWSDASARAPVLLEARMLPVSQALAALAASPRPSAPAARAIPPAREVRTPPPPPSVPGAARAAQQSPAPAVPASPAPVPRASDTAPAENTPPPARLSSGPGTAERDESARATGTSGMAGGPGLLVITEPEGARVTINGVGWGTTPVAIPYLPSGSKRVRVTKSGYESEERVVEPGAAGSGATVRIELRESAAGRLPQ